jgi:hypothetical protein
VLSGFHSECGQLLNTKPCHVPGVRDPGEEAGSHCREWDLGASSACPTGVLIAVWKGPNRFRISDQEALGPRFEHDIKRSLGRAPHARESSSLQYLRKPSLARLSAQRQSNFLRE